MTTVAPPTDESISNDALEQEVCRLQKANHYLMVALDQVPDGMMIFQPGHGGGQPSVIYANCQAHLLAGADPEQGLRGRTVEDLVADEESADCVRVAFKDALSSMGRAECVASLETVLAETGAEPCEWSVRAVVDEHGLLLNYTVRIRRSGACEVVEREEDLDAQAARMRTENMAALAQGIAHDVNNLLGPMMTQLSSTLTKMEPVSELKAELQLMFCALKRARQFTQQVVNTAKARSDERRPTDVRKIAEETARLCRAGANVEIRVLTPESVRWAMADPVRIAQVLQNLVMNGIQAMPSGGWLDIRLENVNVEDLDPSGLAAGHYLSIRVVDRGVGIAPADVKRLFRESFTTKADGNGIGLTTCKRFIEEHQGMIAVTSTLNVGTAFTVLLPATGAEDRLDQVDGDGEAPIPLQKGSGRVLIVDDEDALRHVARCILTQCGYEVEECDNGETAIDLYRSLSREGRRPDVVLMDLTLRGGLSGSETAREILKFDPGAKLVVTSGSVTEDVQRLFLDEGFVGILPKPYEAGALTVTVKEIVERKR